MFVIRTIRNGKVKIKGKWFYPYGDIPYDGRLDGIAYAFGLYEKHDNSGGFEDFVEMWGTASYYYAWGDIDKDEWMDKIPTPHVEKDGRVRWDFWGTREHINNKKKED